MRRSVSLAIAAAALAVMVPTSGIAAGCNGKITKLVGDGKAGSNTIYLDERKDGSEIVGIPGVDEEAWVYRESNGRDGLQTGGPNQTLMLLLEDESLVDELGEVDSCDNYAGPSDTIIF